MLAAFPTRLDMVISSSQQVSAGRVSLEHDGENTMENRAGRRLQVMLTLANRRVILAKTLADW